MWYMIVGEDYADSLENRGAAREAILHRALYDRRRI